MKNAMRRLPLTALRTFEAAARLESFKDAAEELGVSATTVSNQIRALEREWGRLLFVRKTRHVVLTEVGRSLCQVLGQAFDAIHMEIQTSVAPARSSVSMAVGPLFGSCWLTPRLGRFRHDLPRIELSVQRGRRIAGASEMSAAIVVDWGDGHWAGLESQLLLRIKYSPVLSPALSASVGGVRTPADLEKLPILHQYDRSEWKAWLNLVGAGGVRPAGETVIEDSNTVVHAALDGQGVALGSFPFIEEEIVAGRLVKPFDADLSPTRSYYIVTKPGARRRPEIAAVCDWLLNEAQTLRQDG